MNDLTVRARQAARDVDAPPALTAKAGSDAQGLIEMWPSSLVRPRGDRPAQRPPAQALDVINRRRKQKTSAPSADGAEV